MKDPNEEHNTINQQIHYTIQYRRGSYAWVGDVHEAAGKSKYYLTFGEARTAIENNLDNIDEATIIEWKKTPIFVKNIKPVCRIQL